jgi:two-component system response regulator FixJ
MVGADRVVYIVDDDPAVCRSLERLLDSADFRAVAYATPKAFLDAANGLQAGCVLVDLRMPDMSGLEVQEQLHLMKSGLPVIMMTAQGDVQSAVQAMKAGAVDFIEKPYTDEALIVSVESALKGGLQKNRTDETAAAVSLIEMLSPRESQVLDALVAGQANKAISFQLRISVRTVEVHRARMMDRLGVRQLGEAVRLAVLAKIGKDD